jgi:hypothetical protein
MFSAGVLSMKLWGCQLRSIGEADWVARHAVWRRLVERLAVAAGLPLMPGRCSMPSCRFPLARL